MKSKNHFVWYCLFIFVILIISSKIVLSEETIQRGEARAVVGSPASANSQNSIALQPGQHLKKIPKNVEGCSSQNKCQQIDSVWYQKVSFIIGGKLGGLVWDHNKNISKSYDEVYYDFIVDTSSSYTQQPSGQQSTSQNQVQVITFNTYTGDCSYCDANLDALKSSGVTINAENCESAGSSGGECCRAPCPSQTRIQTQIPYYSQTDPVINKRVDASDKIDSKYLISGIEQKSTCWRATDLQQKVNELDAKNSRDYIASLMITSNGKYTHAYTLASSGCGTLSMYMIYKAFGINVDIYDIFCPNDSPLLSYSPEGTTLESRDETAKAAQLSSVIIDADKAKAMTFEQYSELMSQGKTIIINLLETDVAGTEGKNNQMCNGYRQTEGHNVVIVGLSTGTNGQKYFILNDPGGSEKKCKNTIITEEYFKKILKYGINVIWKETTSSSTLSSTNLITYKSTCTSPDPETTGRVNGIIIPSSASVNPELFLYFHGNTDLTSTLGDGFVAEYANQKHLVESMSGKNAVMVIFKGASPNSPPYDDRWMSNNEFDCYYQEALQQLQSKGKNSFSGVYLMGHSNGGKTINNILINGFLSKIIFPFKGVIYYDACYGGCAIIKDLVISNGGQIFVAWSKDGISIDNKKVDIINLFGGNLDSWENNTLYYSPSSPLIKGILYPGNHGDVPQKCFNIFLSQLCLS